MKNKLKQAALGQLCLGAHFLLLDQEQLTLQESLCKAVRRKKKLIIKLMHNKDKHIPSLIHIYCMQI